MAKPRVGPRRARRSVRRRARNVFLALLRYLLPGRTEYGWRIRQAMAVVDDFHLALQAYQELPFDLIRRHRARGAYRRLRDQARSLIREKHDYIAEDMGDKLGLTLLSFRDELKELELLAPIEQWVRHGRVD